MAGQGGIIGDAAVDLVSMFSLVEDKLYTIQNKSDYTLTILAKASEPSPNSVIDNRDAQNLKSGQLAQIIYRGTDKIYVWFAAGSGPIAIVEAA